MATLSRITTWASAQTLTASDLNGEFNNLLNGHNNHDSGSSRWTTVDASTFKLAGQNFTNWFQYRRPVLQYSSATVINLETGLNGTSGDAQILFPDGTIRTDSTASRINFDITRNAALSGTAQSGLRSSLSEATNTWYALYAVKVTDSSSNFVVVGDTLLPLQANFSTLNTNFGANGWVYLGMIRNGDGSAATGDILRFIQVGSVTRFQHVATGNALNMTGIRMATSAAATSITWTYAAGNGATNVPDHCALIYVNAVSNIGSGEVRLRNSAASYDHSFAVAGTGGHAFDAVLIGFFSDNLTLTAGSSAMDIFMAGFHDGVLGVSMNARL